METKAVLDRVEDGGRAVLLAGEHEREFTVPVGQLPAAARAGTWLRVRVHGAELTVLGIDDAEEQAARQRIEAKMARLRKRGSRLRPAGE